MYNKYCKACICYNKYISIYIIYIIKHVFIIIHIEYTQYFKFNMYTIVNYNIF